MSRPEISGRLPAKRCRSCRRASAPRFDVGLGEAPGVLDGHILAAAVGVVDKAATPHRPSIMPRLLERIQDKAGQAHRLHRSSSAFFNHSCSLWLAHLIYAAIDATAAQRNA